MIIALAITFLLLFIVLEILALVRAIRHITYRHAIPAKATIIDHFIEEKKIHSSDLAKQRVSRSYFWLLSYKVDGIEYQKKIRALGSTEYQQFPVGSQVDILYKPRHPKQMICIQNKRQHALPLAIGGLIFLALAALIFAYWYWSGLK